MSTPFLAFFYAAAFLTTSVGLVFLSFGLKGTVQLVVGDENTTVTMILNKNLWLEINANTSSNKRMPARHRSL